MPTLPPNLTSPNIGNLVVGRGYLSMKLIGESSFQDMGNATRLTLQVNPTRLDHYSSRIGVRRKDLTVVTQLDAKMTMTLEEATVRNMQLMVLGLGQESAADSIQLMEEPLFYAAINFTATNVVGPRWNVVLPNVLLTPTNAFMLIAEGSGTWASMEIEGDIQFDQVSQGFGWMWTDDFVPAH
jgi:hypothetical protein